MARSVRQFSCQSKEGTNINMELGIESCKVNFGSSRNTIAPTPTSSIEDVKSVCKLKSELEECEEISLVKDVPKIKSELEDCEEISPVTDEISPVKDVLTIKSELEDREEISPVKDVLKIKSELENFSDELLVTCHDCQKKYSTKEELERHVIRGVCGSISCDTCSKEFINKEEHDEHTQTACSELKWNDNHVKGRLLGFVCLECGKSFVNKFILTRHEGTHQLKTCDHCMETFPSISRLRDHMRKHWPDEFPQECDICHKSFVISGRLRNHKAKVHDVFQCRICGQIFATNDERAVHMRTHGTRTPYECNICGKSFSGAKGLKRHAIIHIHGNPFKCRICGTAFRHYYTMKHHEETHSTPSQKIHRCETCGKTVATPSFLHWHLIVHPDISPYRCQICDAKFENSRALTLHQKRMHDPPVYKCDDCWTTFPSLKILKVHVRTHLEEDIRKCDICNKSIRYSALSHHLLRHRSTKRFGCDFCERRFLFRSHAAFHQLSHTSGKLYSCELCEKGFPTKGQLKTHERTHSDEKPFGCELCPRRFREKSNATAHKRIHSGEKYSCEICGKIYSCRKSFGKHRERHKKKLQEIKCKVCGEVEGTKKQLSNHMRKRHPLKTKCSICGVEVGRIRDHINTVHTTGDPIPCKVCGKIFRYKRLLSRHVKRSHIELKDK